MRAAGEALKQLREQLQKDSLTPEAREQLARQLQSLQDKLRDAAEARQAGQTQQAEQLQQKLESLRQTARQDQTLAQLADKLKSAAQKVQQGDLSSAEEELRSLGEQLQQLESEDLESQALEEALDALADARQSMVCSDCDGQGCQACRGGEGQGNRPGQGMGRGRGAGERPESPTETGKYDAKTRQQTGRGAADVVDRVEGPNVRGEVQTEIAREFAEARAGAADPLTDQQLPRSQREHAREYFEKLRTGN